MRSDWRTRVLVVATHPIQYQAPLFRALARSTTIDVTVAFLERSNEPRRDRGFGIEVQWDVDVLEGYRSLELDVVRRSDQDPSAFMARRVVSPLRQLRALSPDVVLVLGWNQIGLLQMWGAARFLGVPVLVRGDSNEKTARAGYKRLLQRALLATASGFLAVGKSNRAFYRARGVPDARIVMAPHFVDNRRFSDDSQRETVGAARNAVGVPHDDVCITFVGKLEPIKRVPDLLHAVAQLPDILRQRTTLLIAGTGPDEPALRQLAASLALRCVWLGFVNQSSLPAVYRAADLLVLPSTHETWGLVANEAMACCVPVVVSDRVGCADDLVVNGETGAVYPMGDVSALSAVLAGLLRDPAGRGSLARRAQARVFADFSIEASVMAIERAAAMVRKTAQAGIAG